MTRDRRARVRPDDNADDGESDETGRGDGTDAGGGDPGASPEDRPEEGNRRDVVVPRELYKIVTVFSTLIAIVGVVGGFVLLDTATNRTLAAASEVNIPLAVLGVGSIVLGAVVYAFASRFRTRGMGSPNNDADGGSENG